MDEINLLWKFLWLMIAVCAVLTLGLVGFFFFTDTECVRDGDLIVCARRF